MAFEITDSNYKEVLAEGKPVVVDFWAPWCGPCKMVAPIIEELATEFEGQVIIGKCDVDENGDMAAEYGIRNIPTVLFFKNGEIVDKQVGAVGKPVFVEMGLEEDFFMADADDEKTVEFIKNYLPQELKEKFVDDELYYFIDLIDEYYSESGILDAQPDEDGYVNIDLDEVVAYIVKEAKSDGQGEYDPEEILFVVQGEMEYGNSLGQVD